ncbi:MAG: UvrD-helicase domain-containing protein [Chloroflexota bacterium]|nr:UvrD-helicase domain-containing protein [Chloroflexota bacterium]
MTPSDSVVVEPGRFYRLFALEPPRVWLTSDAIHFQRRFGLPAVEIPIGSIDALIVRRCWFWKRLRVRTSNGRERSIGGLGGEATARLHEAIFKEVARHAEFVGLQLKRIDVLLTGDRHYIRHSQSPVLLAVLASVLQECGGLVREHLDQGARESLRRLAPLATDERFEAARQEANRIFVYNSIPAVQAAANSSLPDPLTDEQAEAVASDEDTTLVLAGAGTGKTSVIVGKVAHLIRNLGVTPGDILVLAYNRKAADEIRERLPNDQPKADVFTFHAFGSRVIAGSERAPTISKFAEDETVRVKAVEDILRELLDDPQQSRGVLRFITEHHAPYLSVFDFATPDEYYEHVWSVELRTLNGDRVRSFEELVIGNYLTEHGIAFEYERQYEHETATRERRQYQPDFFLPDYGIYIEHFALNEEGLPPPGWERYLEDVEWKRNIHERYGTKLMETYSWQYLQERLIPELRGQLEEQGVVFERVPVQTLIERLSGERVSWLAGLLTKFLNHVKGGGLRPEELRARARGHRDRQRSERFVEVFEAVHARYEQLLAAQKELDFHDLINLAVRRIREGTLQSPYKYVLVDEFQDISAGRMAMLRALKGPGVAYFLVGDDWQSIYRFAGSDVRLLRGCGEHLGHVKEQVLTQTFRFADGILGPSTAFVQRNPEQTRRPLRPAPETEDDGITIVSSDAPSDGLQRALRDIEEKAQGKRRFVLVLGRYNNSKDALGRRRWNGSLHVEFSTVHRAKGREADYVVVLDLNDGRWGFPSRVEDDPLLEIVLPPSVDSFRFAEERRLFYVAMTRAKIGAYLVAEAARPSEFVTELLSKSADIRVLGRFPPECPSCPSGRLLPLENGENLRCQDCGHLSPRCPGCNEGYAVVSKHAAESATCTNPACDHPPLACPSCRKGVLLERTGRLGPFLGCSQFRAAPSCRYTRPLL